MREFKIESIPLPRSGALAPADCYDLEIGCGAGLHPILYSKENPDRTLVAIERTQDKFEKFERRWHSHQRPANIIPVHDDAISWITHQVAAQTLSRVFILYPNPETSNKNQRFGHMSFMSFLVTRLVDDGLIILATNIESYAQECLERFPLYGLELIENSKPALPGRTHFERKYLERNENCYNLVFKKRSDPCA